MRHHKHHRVPVRKPPVFSRNVDWNPRETPTPLSGDWFYTNRGVGIYWHLRHDRQRNRPQCSVMQSFNSRV